MLYLLTVLYLLVVMRLQELNGSPSYPCWHRHTALCFITEHSAYAPHAPGHGSRHFSFIQARLLGHSLWIKHSGLQLGGTPT